MTDHAEPSGFLSRWSRRKVQVRQGDVPVDPLPPQAPQLPVPRPVALQADDASVAEAATPADPPQAAPPPTLAEVAALTHASDYSRFVAPDVDTGVKNAALKALFRDPHFNVMDGLDTYIDDYGRPDPMPAGMLRQMVQSHALDLFADEPPDAATETIAVTAAVTASTAAAAPNASTASNSPAQATLDEDVALRLQPHDAAGPSSLATGSEPYTGRQC